MFLAHESFSNFLKVNVYSNCYGSIAKIKRKIIRIAKQHDIILLTMKLYINLWNNIILNIIQDVKNRRGF